MKIKGLLIAGVALLLTGCNASLEYNYWCNFDSTWKANRVDTTELWDGEKMVAVRAVTMEFANGFVGVCHINKPLTGPLNTWRTDSLVGKPSWPQHYD